MTWRDIPIARLREVFEYSPETGILTRRITTSNRGAKAGDIAGSVSRYRTGKIYLRTHCDSQIIFVHAIAYAMMTGEWPPVGHEVDHRDLDGLNNRWDNLRLATPWQNRCNKRVQRNKASGLPKGVTWCAVTKRYRAAIVSHGKKTHLGRFDTVADAQAAYAAAAVVHHGEFARSG